MSWSHKYEPKRIPGRKLKSFRSVYAALRAKHYLYFRGKCYHPAVIACWQIGYVSILAERGEFRLEKLNPKRPQDIPF